MRVPPRVSGRLGGTHSSKQACSSNLGCWVTLLLAESSLDRPHAHDETGKAICGLQFPAHLLPHSASVQPTIIQAIVRFTYHFGASHF